MTNEIRILIVEDVAADVVRINHELRQAGMRFRSKRVDTRDDFLKELHEHPPDVILSDHGLPSFDGFAALAVARDQCPHVPFIFVTGSHNDLPGQQFAIDTFKGGASDYILKERLNELAPAIVRALGQAADRARQKESDTELRENEEQFRLVMEGVKNYAIFMLDREGRVTFWNAGACSIFGWQEEEMKGRNFSMLYTDEDAARGVPKKALEIASAEGHYFEAGERIGKGGKRFTAEVTITPVRDKTARLRGYTQVTIDVTSRHLSEMELRQSESLKSFILNTALDAIVLIDQQGKIREWNPAAERIFGFTREQVMGKSPDDLIVPARIWDVYHDGLTQYLMTGVCSLIGRPIELTLKRADGKEFAAELSINREVAEEMPRCTAIVRDITERKQVEAALHASEERYRMLVEDVRDYAIYMLNPEGRVATWNAGAERIKGYAAAEILGQPFATFFTPRDVKNRLPEQLLKQAELEGRASYDGERVRKDGRHIWIQGIITALRDDGGRLLGFSKVAQDITRQKEAETKIRKFSEELEQRVAERTAQLEAANKELEAFSYSISHDLRAPLLRISGFVDIVQEEAAANLDEKSRKHLRTIADGAQQMSRLIDALLDFSRMGRQEMHQERVVVTRLVEEARHELAREIEGREIEWVIGELPETRGDPVMLRLVIINLISNAVKYTRSRQPAKIEIGSWTERGDTVYFVRDNGVGFDMKYVGKLFGVFQRLHPVREFEGTGIGLANVQRIMRRHGGRIWAESAVGQGATFYFCIPRSNKGGSA